MLLLTGILSQALIPALRYSAEARVRVELQQSGVLALNRLVRDLQNTAEAGVSIRSTTPDVVAINTFGNIDGAGRPVWSDTVSIYYHLPSLRQLAAEEPTLTSSSSSLPNSLTDAQLANFISNSGHKERILAREVESFRVQEPIPATASTAAQPLSVTLELGKDLPHTQKRAQVTLVRSVFLRNSP